MNILEIIAKKRRAEALTKAEIDYTVNEFTKGNIADYQMSSLLMAICINSMQEEEIFWLTEAMQKSGDTDDLSSLEGASADKHSSGGVSDTTTLIIAPIVACLGVKMLKASGRGLGHTGGTIDKLEAFDGYKTNMEFDRALALTRQNGACLISQTNQLAPADKLIYALRDASGTVESPALIASSIMSKKLASGNDILVLDVKCGDGAFMKNVSQAVHLANLMVKIGKNAGKKVVAIISNMNQPLGYNIGNTLEVCEAIDVLKGNTQSDLALLSIELASYIVNLAQGTSIKQAKEQVVEVIKNGKALQKFKDMIKSSGGSTKLFDGCDLKCSEAIKCDTTATINAIHCEELGNFVVKLGGGRIKKEDKVDNSVGLKTFFKIGDTVRANDKLVEVFSHKRLTKQEKQELLSCFEFGKAKKQKLILKVVK